MVAQNLQIEYWILRCSDSIIINPAMPKKFTETDFTIAPSTIPKAGLGLFAANLIDIEDSIGYYTGEIIDWESLKSGTFSSSCYILWVTEKHIIVAEGPKANYTRLINHSTEPNALLVV